MIGERWGGWVESGPGRKKMEKKRRQRCCITEGSNLVKDSKP